MSEFVQMVNTSREYALEQKEAIVKKCGQPHTWPTEDLADHNYWEGQVDALEGALAAYRGARKADWCDGYTSALANAREAGYIGEKQFDDLYTEVL